jgi:hypothetical protein
MRITFFSKNNLCAKFFLQQIMCMPYIYISIYLVWEKLKRNKKKNQKEKSKRKISKAATERFDKRKKPTDQHPSRGWWAAGRPAGRVRVCVPALSCRSLRAHVDLVLR